ncbi:mucolipin-1-like [Mercenaria mercenaria]|uniref:mucolipin-1-like n=1 Tax=Mercenaria mercenaria TaxID=6596 RepID=UPI00234F7579|nr:mucolipin-1-like [Mercenaria mercenaria]
MTCCKGFCCKTNENRNEEENPTFQSRLVRIRPNAYFRESCAKLWEVATMFGNALTIAGISIFFQKCGKSYVLADLDKAAVLDGVGLAVCYFTFIRFMKFNSNFSLLFNTIKKAAPGVLSFLLCVGMLFVGSFMFAYVVLGPYHVKFDEPQKTFDTLFSIINGDEIFATMAMLEAKKAGNSGLIATFMYIFVYTYVLLFTVVVFNLLIALFNSAYEEMQKMDEEKKMKKLKDRGLTKGLPDDGSNETQRVDLKEPYELSDLLKEWNPTCSGYIEKEPCSRLRAICYPDI